MKIWQRRVLLGGVGSVLLSGLGGLLGPKIYIHWNLNFAGDQDFKWQVRVLGPGDMRCGGVIVGDEWILTAAHCLTEAGEPSADGAGVNVIAGTRTIADVDPSNVDAAMVHPGYDRCTSKLPTEFDVALIRMKELRKMGGRIAVIQMAAIDEPLPSKPIVAGWFCDPFGYKWLNELTKTVTDCGDRLAFTDIDAMTHPSCKAAYQSTSYVCGAGVRSGFDPTDSGGGLTKINQENIPEVFGVANYVEHPEAYARMTTYRDWVSTCMTSPSDAQCVRTPQACKKANPLTAPG